MSEDGSGVSRSMKWTTGVRCGKFDVNDISLFQIVFAKSVFPCFSIRVFRITNHESRRLVDESFRITNHWSIYSGKVCLDSF